MPHTLTSKMMLFQGQSWITWFFICSIYWIFRNSIETCDFTSMNQHCIWIRTKYNFLRPGPNSCLSTYPVHILALSSAVGKSKSSLCELFTPLVVVFYYK